MRPSAAVVAASFLLLVAGPALAFLNPCDEALWSGPPDVAPGLAGSADLTGNYLPALSLTSRPFSLTLGSLTLGSPGFWPAGPIPPNVHLRQSTASSLRLPLRTTWGIAFVRNSRRQLALSRDAVLYAKAPGSIPPGETLLFAAAYAQSDTRGVRFSTHRPFTARGLEGETVLLVDLLAGSSYTETTAGGPITSDQTVLSLSSLEARPGSGAQGLGFGVHGAVRVELPGGWELSGSVENALSRMWWSGLTQIEALANTSTTVLDPDGYQTVVPVVTGTERRVDRMVEFPVEPTIALSRHQGPATCRLLVDLYADQPAFRPALTWRFRRSTLTLSHHSLDSATTLDLTYGPVTLALITNDLDFSRATALGLHAGLVFSF